MQLLSPRALSVASSFKKGRTQLLHGLLTRTDAPIINCSVLHTPRLLDYHTPFLSSTACSGTVLAVHSDAMLQQNSLFAYSDTDVVIDDRRCTDIDHQSDICSDFLCHTVPPCKQFSIGRSLDWRDERRLPMGPDRTLTVLFPSLRRRGVFGRSSGLCILQMLDYWVSPRLVTAFSSIHLPRVNCIAPNIRRRLPRFCPMSSDSCLLAGSK